MTHTEAKVAAIMAKHGRQLPLGQITPETSMAQDAFIDGIDVDDFVDELEEEFGAVVREIPWLLFSDQRASFRGCLGVSVFPFWLAYRATVRVRNGPIVPRPDPEAFPRLTVRHIAAVIDAGHWFEP